MRKILTLVLAVMLVATFATSAFAAAWNPSDGCKTEVQIKKADSSVVKKDGVIAPGEYEEIQINRDPDATDCYIAYDSEEFFEKACEFLNNVHFYISWDEVNGVNVAVEATLLETPKNLCTVDGNPSYASSDFPGDEFLFQFGASFSIFPDNDSEMGTLYRGFSKNTATGELLYGYYTQNGVLGNLNQTAGTDYTVVINGNKVTYEMSFPMNECLPAASLNGTSAKAGSQIYFDIGTTGGSQGMYHLSADDAANTTGEDCATYAVGIGDSGFLSAWNTYNEPSHVIGLFSDETITTGGGEVDPPVENPPAENPPAENPPAENPPAENPPAENPPAENPPSENPPAENPNGGNNTPSAPQTADAGVIAAVVSVLSAAGYAVSRRRK